MIVTRVYVILLIVNDLCLKTSIMKSQLISYIDIQRVNSLHDLQFVCNIANAKVCLKRRLYF